MFMQHSGDQDVRMIRVPQGSANNPEGRRKHVPKRSNLHFHGIDRKSFGTSCISSWFIWYLLDWQISYKFFKYGS